MFERETEAYFKMDPDPMDDRHPGKLLFCFLPPVFIVFSFLLMHEYRDTHH